MSVRVPADLRDVINVALDDKDVRWGRDDPALAAKYGGDIARWARALREEAIDTRVDWKRETAMDEGIGQINARCERDYPWLTKGARGSLVQAFIMTWK